MSQTVARCEAAMPLDLLSAWHDHEVTPDVAQRVRQHVATCQACQTQLAAYEADGRAIRDFAPPPLQDAIWRNVQPVTAQPSSRRSAPPRGVILGGLGAALAVVLLFATISVIYLNNHGHSLTVVPTGTPAATNMVAPTATVATLSVSPSQGWVSVPALAFGKAIAFSQSDPLTGYACGNATADNTQPLLLGTTHDGGRTWSQPVSTSIKGDDCQLFINHTEPQDLVMLDSLCWETCGDNPFSSAYRSLDGGKTWTHLSLPPGNEQTYFVLIGQPIWAGNTLFVSAVPGGALGDNTPPPPHQIAVSINDAPFHWIDLSKLTSSTSVFVSDTFAVGATYYLVLSNGIFAKTDDGGAAWTQLQVNIASIGAITPLTDNKTWIAINSQSVERSTDEGSTWIPLPNLPENIGLKGRSGILSTPDGALYAVIVVVTGKSTNIDFYEFSANAQKWELATEEAFQNVIPYSVSWNEEGHAIAFWQSIVTLTSNGVLFPGIQYHAP